MRLQMQYGSIGWSVGALLGYSAALRGKKRVVACIGDGSFQVTAQVGPQMCATSIHVTAITGSTSLRLQRCRTFPLS